MAVRVTLEGMTRAELDQRLLAAARERLKSVGDAGDITVVVARDLDSAIRRRLPPAEASAYSVNRVSGAVGAKTIPRQNGCEILIDGRILVPGAARGAGIDVPRLFEHEAWHAALHRRGEGFDTAFSRLGLSGAEAYYVGQALVLIDDYRVERALAERGYRLDPSYVPSTRETLDGSAAAFLDAVTNRYPGEPTERCFKTAFQSFCSLTTHIGYLLADDADVGPLRALPRWNRLVGDHHDSMGPILDEVRSAATAADPDSIDTTAKELGDLLRVWFHDIGFEIRDVSSGLYFDVLRHDF